MPNLLWSQVVWSCLMLFARFVCGTTAPGLDASDALAAAAQILQAQLLQLLPLLRLPQLQTPHEMAGCGKRFMTWHRLQVFRWKNEA